ncbi:MAG: hypothetical protein JWR83_3623 [Aeromicrobium sp.]|nr:hypothetical protein [Aeromicrobium sp.]
MRKAHGVLTALVLALALTAAGCGSSGDGNNVASAKKPSSKTSATPKLSNEEKAVKFTECLRAHGLDVKDPEPGQGGISITGKSGGPGKDDVDKAMKACQKYDAARDLSGKPNPKGQEMALKMSKCMRAHGVEDFPDPVDGGIRLDASLMNDPDFKAADKICQKLMGGKGSTHIESGKP